MNNQKDFIAAMMGGHEGTTTVPEPSAEDLAKAAKGLKETYNAFVDAGFTEDQAMFLVSELIKP